MSTKGKQLTTATRQKISLTKEKFSKSHLTKSYEDYIKHLQDNPKELPTLEGYALAVGTTPDTIREYARKYKEVHRICEHIKTLQAQTLITEGSNNKRNSVFSIFLLKSQHGYSDQPQQLTQNNYMNISPEVMKEALTLMQSKEDD